MAHFNRERQPGILFHNVMNDQDRKNLVSNIVSSMSGITGGKKDEIINRQICHFFRADSQLGMKVAKGLGVTIDEKAMAIMNRWMCCWINT